MLCQWGAPLLLPLPIYVWGFFWELYISSKLPSSVSQVQYFFITVFWTTWLIFPVVNWSLLPFMAALAVSSWKPLKLVLIWFPPLFFSSCDLEPCWLLEHVILFGKVKMADFKKEQDEELSSLCLNRSRWDDFEVLDGDLDEKGLSVILLCVFNTKFADKLEKDNHIIVWNWLLGRISRY